MLIIPCNENSGSSCTQDVFNHRKRVWIFILNSMSLETVAAKLKIRLNCQMKCNESFSFVQSEPELIKSVRRAEKYNCTKKSSST